MIYAPVVELADTLDLGDVTSGTNLQPELTATALNFSLTTEYAGMAELADAQDLGSCVERRAGSTPVTRTIEGAPILA